jgi:hypothetical protein
MDKRVRSPNYPALSLPDAVTRAGLVYKNQHTHGAPREVVAKSMGYNSLNGASATAVSALIKYGLLEGRAEDIRISDRAMRILHPESPEEKAEAIREAAREPALFQELDEKFPGRTPSEEVLRNHLLRTGFAPNAVSSVILAYRETKDFAEREGGAYDSGAQAIQEAPPMHTAILQSAPPSPAAHPAPHGLLPAERQIGLNDLEGGEYVKIVATKGIDTEEALEWAADIIERKRRELTLRRERARRRVDDVSAEPENSDDGAAKDA